MKTTEKSLFEYLKQFAAQAPDKRFLFTEEYSLTAKQLFGRVCGVGRQLSAVLTAGDVAVLRATRCLGTAIIFYALQCAGVTTVLTDPHSPAEKAVSDSGIKIDVKAYITNETANGGTSADGDWLINGIPLKTDIGTDCEFGKVDVHAPAVVIFTSGSTGICKAVTLSQYNYLNHTLNYGYGGCYSENDVSMEILPIHHVFGLAVLTTALMYRYELLFPKEVNVKYITQCLNNYRITRLDGVPSFANAVAAEVSRSKTKTYLRIGVIGGAPVSAEKFAFIEDTLKLTLVPVYGMSECIGISGAPIETDREMRRTTVGVFLPMNSGKITDEGEICVKSPAVMMGYWGDKESTEAVIDCDGFLHTGDLGYLDGNGFLHISGRKKDIIIRNGNNISAMKIERKISSLPGVKDVCVVGVEDEVCGEVPCALIVAERPVDLNPVLTKIEMPFKVIYASAVPLTSSGKPDKQKIIKLFA